MINCVCSKYNSLLKKQFAVYSLGRGVGETSLITLTEQDYYGAYWRKILFKMLLEGYTKAI